MKRYILLLAVLVFYPVAKAPGQNPAASSSHSNAPPNAPAAKENFIIGKEDVLAIIVWREPELSVKDVMVRPDGMISLPLVSDIQASGLTPKQLQEKIAERLKEFIAAPNVTVAVTKIASQSITVIGKVSRPGVYYLGAPMNVLELLARAGGFQEEAKTKKIKIVRTENGKMLSFSFNYNEVSEGKKLQQNITLQNGDTVIVP